MTELLTASKRDCVAGRDTIDRSRPAHMYVRDVPDGGPRERSINTVNMPLSRCATAFPYPPADDQVVQSG